MVPKVIYLSNFLLRVVGAKLIAIMAEPRKRMDVSRARNLFKSWVVNIVMAPIIVAKVSARMYGKTVESRKKWWPYAVPSLGSFSLFVLFHILDLVVPGCWSIAWFFYLCFVCQITAVRIKAREIFLINGNAAEDFFSSLILYPNVVTQLDITTSHLSEEGNKIIPEATRL